MRRLLACISAKRSVREAAVALRFSRLAPRFLASIEYFGSAASRIPVCSSSVAISHSRTEMVRFKSSNIAGITVNSRGAVAATFLKRGRPVHENLLTGHILARGRSRAFVISRNRNILANVPLFPNRRMRRSRIACVRAPYLERRRAVRLWSAWGNQPAPKFVG
jgi:hypothetical protein